MREFEETFGDEDPSTVSKYKKYKSKYYQYVAFGIFFLMIAAASHEVVNFRVVESPYPNLTLYSIPIILFIISFAVYLGYRDIDMTSERALYYEMSKSIESFRQGNYDRTAAHVKEIDGLVSGNSVGVFSERKESKISEYKDNLENSNSRDQLIENKFEDFMTPLIEDITSLSSLDELYSSLEGNEDEFDKSTTADAIARLVGRREILIILIIITSLAVYNFVNQQAEFYFAVILLSTMELILSQRD